MKKPLTFLLFTLFFGLTSLAQQTKLEPVWAKQIIKSGFSFNFIKADAQKNVYILTNFDTLEVETLLLESANKKSSVLLKFDSTGNLLWHFAMMDNALNVTSSDLLVQGDNVYITGNYAGEFQITPTIKLDSNSYWSNYLNIFFAKLDLDGNVLWAKGFDQSFSGGAANLFSVGVDKIGLKRASPGYAPYYLGDSLIDLGGPSIGMAVFDANGNATAVKAVPRWDSFNPWIFTADENGNVYGLLLLKEDSLIIDGTVFKKTNLSNTGYLLIKMDENLEVQWTKLWEDVAQKKYSADLNDRNLIADNAGNFYFVISFSDTFEVEGKQVISKEGLNFLIAKVNSNGEVQWLKQSDSPQGLQWGIIDGLQNNRLFISASHTWGAISFDDFENISSPAKVILNTGDGKAIGAANKTFGGFNVYSGTAEFVMAPLYESSRYTIKGTTYTQKRPMDLLIIMLDSTQATGIKDDNGFAGKFKIYPNPAKDQFTVELPENTILLESELLDLQGRSVRFFEPGTEMFSVAGLKKGQYFLRLRTNNGIVVKKVMVQ